MNILDPNFKYVPSYRTNIRETLERARNQINAARQASKEIGAIQHSASIDQRLPAVSAPNLRRIA